MTRIVVAPNAMTQEQRSYNMSRIRSSANRSTELAMIKFFREYGVKGWRRHVLLAGKPDFVFRKQHIALFIDGCFWHGCEQHCQQPKSNIQYWHNKLRFNKQRDREVNAKLHEKGWIVIRVWEHTVRQLSNILSPENLPKELLYLLNSLNQ